MQMVDVRINQVGDYLMKADEIDPVTWIRQLDSLLKIAWNTGVYIHANQFSLDDLF